MRILFQLALFTSSLLLAGCLNSSSPAGTPNINSKNNTSTPKVNATSTEMSAGGFDSGGGDFIPAGLDSALEAIDESISNFGSTVNTLKIYRKFISSEANDDTNRFFDYYMSSDYQFTKDDMQLLTKRAIRDVVSEDSQIQHHPAVVKFLNSSTPEEADAIGNEMLNNTNDRAYASLMQIYFSWSDLWIGVLKVRSNILSAKKSLGELKIKEDEPCYDHSGNPKPASVDEFNLLGTVCISAFEVAKLPKASLKENITALLIHEVSHLFNYSEPQAESLQDYVLDVYSQYGIKRLTELGSNFSIPELFEYNFINYGQALAKHLEKNGKVDVNDPDYDHLISKAAFLYSLISNIKFKMEDLRDNLLGLDSTKTEDYNEVFDRIFGNIEKMYWPTFRLRREIRNYSSEELEKQVVSIFQANLEIRKDLSTLGADDSLPDPKLSEVGEIKDFLNFK